MKRQWRWAGVASATLGCLVSCGGDSDDAPRDAGRDTRRNDTAAADNRADTTSVDVTKDAAGADVDLPRQDATVTTDAVTTVDVKVADVVVGEPAPDPDPTAVLGAKSADCLSCAKARCPLQIAGCAEITGTAMAGPANGTSRASLCVETLACVVPNGCAADMSKSWTCYCDGLAIAPTLCYSAGPCKPVFERSMEATDPAVVVSSFSDTSKGGGWAMTLLQCLSDNRCNSCLDGPPVDAGRIVDAPRDAVDASGTGGSGGTGTGGTGGSGGTGTGGAGGSGGTGTGGSGGSVDSGASDADGGDAALDSVKDSSSESNVAIDAADRMQDASDDASADLSSEDAATD